MKWIGEVALRAARTQNGARRNEISALTRALRLWSIGGAGPLAGVTGSVEPLETTMQQKKWTFPVLKAARWASDTTDGDDTARFENWVLWISVSALPLDFPLDPNARHPDLNKPTPKAIARTLTNEPSEFVKRNSGICMVARSCLVRDNVATILLNLVDDQEERDDGRRGDGILNGGHTYGTIKKVLAEFVANEDDVDPRTAVVRLEVQTGLAEDDLAEISRARNKSEPVEEFSLKNLGNAWQDLKQQLPAEMRKRVAFMENDPAAPDADFDVGDLVRLLALFNSRLYPVGEKDPIHAYTSEKRLIATWSADDYRHLLPHLIELVRLHDEVTLLYPKVVNNFGNVSGVIPHGKKPITLLGGKTSKYFVPPPFTFPVLAALRAFLSDDGSRWIIEPDVLVADERYMKALIQETWSQYRTAGRNSAAFFGRNRQVWKMLALMALVKRQSLKT